MMKEESLDKVVRDITFHLVYIKANQISRVFFLHIQPDSQMCFF